MKTLFFLVPPALLLVLPAAPGEGVAGADRPVPRQWEITAIRAERNGRVINSSSSPMMVYEEGDFIGTMSINMGSREAPRIWQLDYAGSVTGPIRFEVQDTTNLHRWTSEGTSHTMPVGLFDVVVPGAGPGRYPVFSLDGETLSVELGPVGGSGARPGTIEPPLEVVLTMRDPRGEILSEASAPWHEEADGDGRAILALRLGDGADASFQLVEIRAGLPQGEVRFRVKDLVGTRSGGGPVQLERFVVRLPARESGHYPVYSWDQGTLVASIRAGAGDGHAPPYGAD